jgi:hypothetical protein
MDHVGRLLLRILLVPLGGMVAVAVAVVVVVAAHWGAIRALATADPERQGDYMMALVAAGPELFVALSTTMLYTLAAAAIGVLVAEVFAVRSWIFHAANGGLSAWIGWSLSATGDGGLRAFSEPKILIAAGLAAGLAYWLIAGSTAGFFKPLRTPRLAQPGPATR